MTPEEAAKTDQPVMFISFPSAKDPKAWAQKYPGKIGFLSPYHLCMRAAAKAPAKIRVSTCLSEHSLQLENLT